MHSMHFTYKVYYMHQSKLTILLEIFEFIRIMIHFCTKVVDECSIGSLEIDGNKGQSLGI